MGSGDRYSHKLWAYPDLPLRAPPLTRYIVDIIELNWVMWLYIPLMVHSVDRMMRLVLVDGIRSDVNQQLGSFCEENHRKIWNWWEGRTCYNRAKSNLRAVDRKNRNTTRRMNGKLYNKVCHSTLEDHFLLFLVFTSKTYCRWTVVALWSLGKNIILVS